MTANLFGDMLRYGSGFSSGISRICSTLKSSYLNHYISNIMGTQSFASIFRFILNKVPYLSGLVFLWEWLEA